MFELLQKPLAGVSDNFCCFPKLISSHSMQLLVGEQDFSLKLSFFIHYKNISVTFLVNNHVQYAFQ